MAEAEAKRLEQRLLACFLNNNPARGKVTARGQITCLFVVRADRRQHLDCFKLRSALRLTSCDLLLLSI